MESSTFKKCPMCAEVWQDRQTFLYDKSLYINGYQANFERFGQGLIYFTHIVEGCHSTMAMRAEEFFDLNPNTPFRERKASSQECPRYCFDRDNLKQCSAECEGAFVRDLLQVLKNMKSDDEDQNELAADLVSV